MRKLLFIILLLCIPVLCFSSPPARQNTYTAGDTILSDDVTENEDAIFNYLTSGVDTIKDGIIVNADISASANIQSSKLNLDAVDTMTITSSLTLSSTTSMGWEIATSANQDCNTTCTNACIFGFDDGNSTIVACGDSSADRCLCGGQE
uniref:Uncharacterized protein n=1 Tax=viral metagenome TaxID=1070528 RepID=A0A6M3L5X2_9ZZZZ